MILKPATHLVILYTDRDDLRKLPGVSGAAITIFADRRDRRIKSRAFAKSVVPAISQFDHNVVRKAMLI